MTCCHYSWQHPNKEVDVDFCKKILTKLKNKMLYGDLEVVFAAIIAVMLFIFGCFLLNVTAEAEEPQPTEESEPAYMTVLADYEVQTYSWQKLGYGSIFEWKDALDEAVAGADGVAEEAIALYSSVITEEQKEILRDCESHMVDAASITTYSKYLDKFNEVCAECEEKLSAIKASYSSSSNSSSSEKSYMSGFSSAKEFIMYHESRGDYTATNGKYYGAYQLDISYLGGDLSPENQDRVAEEYVNSRYGGWDGAMAHFQSHGWY